MCSSFPSFLVHHDRPCILFSPCSQEPGLPDKPGNEQTRGGGWLAKATGIVSPLSLSSYYSFDRRWLYFLGDRGRSLLQLTLSCLSPPPGSFSGAEHEHPRSTTSRSRHTVGVIPGNDRPIPSLHVTHIRSLGVVFLGFDTTHCVSRVYVLCVCVCEWRVLRGLVNSPKDSGTKNMATSVASFFFCLAAGWLAWLATRARVGGSVRC